MISIPLPDDLPLRKYCQPPGLVTISPEDEYLGTSVAHPSTRNHIFPRQFLTVSFSLTYHCRELTNCSNKEYVSKRQIKYTHSSSSKKEFLITLSKKGVTMNQGRKILSTGLIYTLYRRVCRMGTCLGPDV